MKALLKIVYFLLFLVILILLAGIFLPKSVSSTLEIKVNSRSSLVYDQINSLQNWKEWSPWLNSDTLTDIKYGQITTGRGASLEWDSDIYDSGSLEISACEENIFIEGAIDFGSFGMVDFRFDLQEENEQTQLKWKFSNKNIAYFERYFMFLFSKKLEASLMSALEKIGEISEELRLSRMSEPILIEQDLLTLMVIIDTVKTVEHKKAHEKAINRVEKYLKRRKIDTIGNPLCIYYSYDPSGNTIFGSGFPISKKTWSWGDYTCLEIEEGKVATTTHWGDFSSAKPYLALDEFLLEHKLEADSFIWEAYYITEEDQPDTSLWEKQLFYPVKE